MWEVIYSRLRRSFSSRARWIVSRRARSVTFISCGDSAQIAYTYLRGNRVQP